MQELLRVEEEEVQRRAQERRAQMEEEELLFQQVTNPAQPEAVLSLEPCPLHPKPCTLTHAPLRP